MTYITLSDFINLIEMHPIFHIGSTVAPTTFVNGLLNMPDTILDVVPLLSGIFQNFIGIFSDLTNIIHLFDFFPSQWVTIMVILLGIVIALRLYAFFSDIQIAGFKI